MAFIAGSTSIILGFRLGCQGQGVFGDSWPVLPGSSATKLPLLACKTGLIWA